MPPKPRSKGPRVRTPGGPEAESRTRRLLYVIAATGFAGLLVALALVVFGGGSGTADAARVQTAVEAAGCTLTAVEADEGDHSVPAPGDRVESWNTFPPTNGPHYVDPAIFGAYQEPLNQAQVVHDLEHGGIFVQYGEEVSAETVAELRAFYDRNQNGTLLAPLPELGEKIALGAWVAPSNASGATDLGTGYLAECTSFDEDAFAAFFDEFQFKGPERFPADLLAPGN